MSFLNYNIIHFKLGLNDANKFSIKVYRQYRILNAAPGEFLKNTR